MAQQEKDNPILIGAKDLNRQFSKEYTQMLNKYMKRQSLGKWK